MSDAARALPEAVSALPPGTRLAEFEIKGLLGVGGFGIVYLAFDHALEREVAIKEYMPASMAGRTETLHVSLRSQSDAEVFALGLRSFVNEAKLLARFDHPSLIKVHRFWEANGTAYMAMPVLRGRTLKDIRRATGRGPDEAWIRGTLVPLLGALETLHNEGVYHRDIAPDNIHLETDGHPVLLDFGAARRVITGKTQTLTAILKPAYAPIEQYAESAAVKQGPWTDIYALGATLHYMLLGYPPAPATARTVSDEASELLTQTLPGISPQLLAIIDWMLAPRPNQRPQSVAALRAALDGRAPVPQRAVAAAPPATWDKTVFTTPVTVPLADLSHADLDLDMGAPPAMASPQPAAGQSTRAMPHAAVTTHAETQPMSADGGHRLPPPPSRGRVVPLALAGLVLVGVVGYAGWAKFGPAVAGAAPQAASAPVASPGTGGASAVAGSPTAGPAAAGVTGAAGAVTPNVATPSAAATQSPTPTAAASAAAEGSVAATPTPTTAANTGAQAPGPVAAASAPPRGARTGTAGAGATTGSPGGRTAQASPAERPATQAPAPQGGNAPSNANGTSPAAQGAGNAANAGTGAATRSSPQAGTVGLPASGPATAAAASAAAEPGPGATPEARCGGRNPLSYFVCMERECYRPRFKGHPECLAWRQQARPRDGSGG